MRPRVAMRRHTVLWGLLLLMFLVAGSLDAAGGPAVCGGSDSSGWTVLLEASRNVATVMSVLFVLLAFLMARKDRRQDRLLSVESFWYQELILRTHLPTLRDGFAGFDTLARTLVAEVADLRRRNAPMAAMEAAIGRAIRALNEFKKGVDRGLVDDLYVVDAPLGVDFRALVRSFQDDTCAAIEALVLRPNEEGIVRTIGKYRERAIAMLYRAHRVRAGVVKRRWQLGSRL